MEKVKRKKDAKSQPRKLGYGGKCSLTRMGAESERRGEKKLGGQLV